MKKPTEKLKDVEEFSIIYSLEKKDYELFPIDSIIEKLQECKDGGFDKINYSISQNYWGYTITIRAFKHREETDEEFQHRLNQWQNLQLKRKTKKKENLEREKQEYERLKKKFEK